MGAKPKVLSRAAEIQAAANAVASDRDADVMLINAGAVPGLHLFVHRALSKRTTFRPTLHLILVTEGGSADGAYRAMRMLQDKYKTITAVVPGWCKSAGTLMCIGANTVRMGPLGELGPLDVQIVRPDQHERTSGLAIDTAVEKLQHEAFKIFVGFIREMGESEYRFSLKTAAEVAQNVSIGLLAPVFQKLDPISIGEDFRSYKVAQAYAERLNLKSQNLRINQRVDALASLLGGYPTHGFAIDINEAKSLFMRVGPMGPKTTKLVDLLGTDALFPLDREREQARVDFLSDEPPPISPPTSGSGKATKAAKASQGGAATSANRTGRKRA